MAVKNDNTLITKGDLKKFYNKILPYMGGNYVFNTLGTKDYYSEDEKVIGVWTDGKPVYQGTDGKIIPIWIKLIRYQKNGKEWRAISKNGDLSFPTFVGEGVIEIFNQNAAPCIHLNVMREAIRPMTIETQKEPNLPGLGGPAMPGYMDGGMPAFNPSEIADDGESPF